MSGPDPLNFLYFSYALYPIDALPSPPLIARGSLHLLPSEDAFYQPPRGFENEELGAILRARQLPGKLQAFNLFKEEIASAYQLLYRIANSFGEPEAMVTTVLVPRNADSTQLLS